MGFLRALLLTCAAAIAVPGVAEARTIGTAGASGDYAIALASGSASHPRTIRVVVSARPRQKVSVSWTMVCTKGFGAGSKSGSFSGYTKLSRKLRKPMNRPDNCTVSASAQLDGSGRVRVSITAT